LNLEAGDSPSSLDSFLNILRSLARAKLDDAKVGEAALDEGIFADDRFDLLQTLADRDDDSTVSRNLSTRDQEVAGSVVVLQEGDVRGHIRVDFSEMGLVNELDDIHGRSSLQHWRGSVKKEFQGSRFPVPRFPVPVLRFKGSVHVERGTLEPWNLGTLEPWNFGTLEPWNPGTLEPWNFGTLEPSLLIAKHCLFYSVKEVPRGDLLGSLEHIVLLALVRLEDNAYGMTVRREIEERTGRNLSIGAVYATLDRLETKGYVSSILGEPTAERGGRAKRLFRIEADGEAALRVSQEAIRRMTAGLRRRWGTT
jgi:PadR family transcriptional regulator PadR